jgi:hypothetical protein
LGLRKALLGCIVGIAILLAGAASAPASTVSRSGGLVFVIASEGERNVLSIEGGRTDDTGRVAIRDEASPLVAGTFCEPTGDAIAGPERLQPELPAQTATVTCEAEELAAVVVLAGDRDDIVRIVLTGDVVAYVVGGPGDDAIHGGARAHVLQGGQGADRLDIEENIGGVDIVEGGDGPDLIDVVAGAGTAIARCGAGYDILELDTADRPSDGCEGQSFPAPTADTTPEDPPKPARAPSDPIAPELPRGRAAAQAAARASSTCGLRPKRRSGALTVRLRPGGVGRGSVSWAIYGNASKSLVRKTGSDPVVAGRREELTAMRRKLYFKVWVTSPQPCP